MNPQRRWFRLVPVTLVMGTIFMQSHQSGDSFSLPNISNIDKLVHCLVYAVLGLTAIFALTPQFRQRRPWLASGVVVLFCLFYGISDEFHQSFIPGRISSGADLAADALGGVVAVVGYWAWRQWSAPGEGA